MTQAPRRGNYDSQGGCFPGQETSFVSLSDGTKKKIEEVEVGDRVKMLKENGGFGYSEVYSLGHKNKDRKTTFIRLSTASARIPISPRHFIRVNGDYIFAKDVKMGDTLLIDVNNKVKEEEVLEIENFEARGLYAPFTEEGNIIINDVVASCYAEVKPCLAHQMLAPIRGFKRYLPKSIMNVVMTPNKDGVPAIFDAALTYAHPLVVE